MKKEEKIYCNMCGRGWERTIAIYEKDFLCIRKDWGYFSKKDGQHHEIIMCEECYDKWIKTLNIAPDISDTLELL